ncbi:MAG: lectin [Candidatus Eremiobacteraeota bacterium]|nr:lectin [Candidatus Eremiobacteraeota bacterium]MCW5872151.1 lectin [Candidatus Eremiobacteraeota bacterium]
MRKFLLGAGLFVTMACSAFAQAGGILQPGSTMFPGQVAWSSDGRYHLNFQEDGNLVLYNNFGTVMWATQTNGAPATELRMQPDGNLVMYGNGQTIWASNTAGHPGAQLRVQNDGNVVIYSPRQRVLWATESNGRG